MSFANKVVLITGGSSGIGAATAVLFAEAGADVAIVGRNEAKLNSVAELIQKNGKKPLVIKADVSKNSEANTIVKQTVDEFGKLDVLVNNAGVLRTATILEGNALNVYDEVMNTNLRSVVHITSLAVPHLVKTKGSIVNISSVAGSSVLGNPGYGAYCTSKAGLNHFTRASALELAAHGVRVNSVSPGPVKTDILEGSGTSMVWDKMKSTTALCRISNPEEIADLIMYLASDKAQSITGSDYIIDNGILLKK